MPSIRLLTHLNGPDNQGGAPWGMPGVTYLVEDAVAQDAVRRGFAVAVAVDAVNTEADQLAHLHAAPSVARGNAVAARLAAGEAAAAVKVAQAEADRADALATEAEAFADRAEKGAPEDAPGSRPGLTSKDPPGARAAAPATSGKAT